MPMYGLTVSGVQYHFSATSYLEKMLFWIIGCFLAISLTFGEGKIFNDTCTLAKELDKQGFAREELSDWICLIEHESTFNTSAVGPENSDGSNDHGLFQINDKYWCEHGRRGGECNVSCEDLRSDDITAACKCARRIKKVHKGFSAWVAWNNRCANRSLPKVDHCFKSNKSC